MYKKWKCLVYGVIFDGDVPPNPCPVCGASSDNFEEVLVARNDFADDSKLNFVIIGNGAAGFYAADSVRNRNKNCNITMISKEKTYSYYRPLLSEYLNKEKLPSNFYLSKENWFEEKNINLILNTAVNNINPVDKKVLLSNGKTLNYDKLILANGGYNFIPPIEGKDKKGVFTLRNLEDSENVKDYAKKIKHATVIGGGLLGLEAAWELRNIGLDVSVIEFFDRLLPRQLDEKAGKLFQDSIKQSNVDIILGDSVVEILGDNSVESIKLKSGKEIKTDMVLFSIGIRSNKELAENCGLKTDKAVIVNEKMETNIDDIYACGDVAEFNGKNYGNWPAAVQMGKVAGANASGDNLNFKDFVSAIIFRAMNTKMFTCGNCADNMVNVAYEDPKNGTYKKLFFEKDILVGATLLGDISSSGKLVEQIKNKTSIKDIIK
ncbi:hypothetical protein K144313037_22850 [Clostridium tetani]|uniref:FAD-dependent oxidoreductase n=1 Tax=Clostridium tetani TaxID=1513 RepID=UPI002953769C|nr:FAD-dependent oxidoreductase [Clostridium tetani]BDR70873.1 hypothetical protein K144313037_22850 [Clostridium tetani]BEV20510.1 hypothetical protein K154301001_23650 [Clostridium tetani]